MEHKQNSSRPKPEGFDPRLLREAARLAAAFGFAPVPVRHRRDGWTVERQLVYLAVLAAGGRSGEAAARVGMTVQSAAKLLRRPDAGAFARACAAACRMGEPRRRAVAAERRPKRRLSSSGTEVFHPQGSRNS
jgi:hypothetical protein